MGASFILGINDYEVAAFSSTSTTARTTAAGTRDGRVNSMHTLFSKLPRCDQSSTEMEMSTGGSLPEGNRAGRQSTTTALAVSFAIAVATASTMLPAQPANAYIPSDYASETVQIALKELNAAKGKADKTFEVYESISKIIIEGKGVGGQINYKGIELERGFVADEDTTIYNPGLTLLTESEKERLVEGVIDGRKAGLKANQWSDENQYAYDFLVTKLDPLHTVELKGFLGIVPYYGAAIYVAVVAVQQLSRDAFQVAYVLGAAAFFLPIVGLVLAGP